MVVARMIVSSRDARSALAYAPYSSTPRVVQFDSNQTFGGLTVVQSSDDPISSAIHKNAGRLFLAPLGDIWLRSENYVGSAFGDS